MYISVKDRDMESIFIWFQSCVLFFFDTGVGGFNLPGDPSTVLSAIWLVCMKLSLAMLLVSPLSMTLGGAEGRSAVETSEGPTLLASLSALCC